MKREDFKEITEEHLGIAKKIIRNNGCRKIKCNHCPFFNYMMDCSTTERKIGLAKQFLELFDTEPKSLNFYERLSATLYGKQVLFKQDDGSYYNQRLDESMTKSDVKEWLLAEVGELCNDDK